MEEFRLRLRQEEGFEDMAGSGWKFPEYARNKKENPSTCLEQDWGILGYGWDKEEVLRIRMLNIQCVVYNAFQTKKIRICLRPAFWGYV